MATDDTSFKRGLYEHPLSRGAVRQFVGSQPSGGGDYNDYFQAPSFNDVRGLQASESAPSFSHRRSMIYQITEEEALAGMSLTASDFKRIDPDLQAIKSLGPNNYPRVLDEPSNCGFISSNEIPVSSGAVRPPKDFDHYDLAQPMSQQEALDWVSLTASNFNRINPNAIQKEQ